MAVKLRLKQLGRSHRRMFRVAAMDVRNARDGRTIEELGSYDPGNRNPDQQIRIKRDRIEHWLSVGAQPTETVRDLLKRSGIAVK